MKLVLFDIDGTILLTDGAGRRAVTRALADVFGATGPENHRFDGKTDPQIVREMMRIAGFEDSHIDDRMPALLETYVTYLHDELRRNPAGVHLMPGVEPLIDALHRRTDLILGLLTGNLAEGASAKLSAAGIDPRLFRVGAFGSDHEIRGELPAVAQRRAREMLGHDIAGRDVVVIGDTPSDLQCGRSIGARAIGVATGRFSVDELRQHDPVAVFANFTDTNAVVEAIVGDMAGGNVAMRDR